MRTVLLISVVVMLSGCASDERACKPLVTRCKDGDSLEWCRTRVRKIRDEQGADGMRLAQTCLDKAKTCDEAKSCVRGSDWTDWAPYGGTAQ